jgi:hypothetical protein
MQTRRSEIINRKLRSSADTCEKIAKTERLEAWLKWPEFKATSANKAPV